MIMTKKFYLSGFIPFLHVITGRIGSLLVFTGLIASSNTGQNYFATFHKLDIIASFTLLLHLATFRRPVLSFFIISLPSLLRL